MHCYKDIVIKRSIWGAYVCVLFLASGNSVIAAEGAEPAAEVKTAEELALQAGRDRLKSFLSLHATATPYDSSQPYKNLKNTFRGHIEGLLNEKEHMPLDNLYRDAIAVFEESDWLASQYASDNEMVCEGTQLLQDLEIVAGKAGNEKACVLSSLIPAGTSSCFGKVSAALLLAQPVLRETLLQRQSALRYFADDEHGDVYNHLTDLFDKVTASQRYLIPELKSNKNEGNGQHMGLLLLMLPGLKKIKEHPLGQTIDDVYSKGASLFWTLLLGAAAVRMGVYGIQALQSPDGKTVQSNSLLSIEQIEKGQFKFEMQQGLIFATTKN